MIKKFLSCMMCAALCIGLTTPALARGTGFSDVGGYSDSKMEYTFMVEDSIMVFSKDADPDFTYLDEVYSGSSLYVPIGVCDTTANDPVEVVATDKNIKNDSVQLSYKVLQGYDYVSNVTLVSGKKEKITGLPAGSYAKVEFTNDYLPLTKTRVSVRLVLSVNGVSYQDTGVTYNCNLLNRSENISKNSVYGALVPSQFKVSSNYRGEATFDFGNNIKYTGRVLPGRKYYLNLDRTVNLALDEMYPDAYMEFYNFKGDNDTFASVGKLEIPVNKAKFKEKKTQSQVYAYELVGDRLTALTKNDLTYDSQAGKLILETQTLGSYVLSSRALMKNISDSSEEDILRSGYADDLDDEPEALEGSAISAKKATTSTSKSSK